MVQPQIPSMQDFLGIRVTELSPSGLCATMPVTERSSQIHGLLNGGASLAMCEICSGTLSEYLLKGTGKIALGISVSASHLNTARLGETVTCTVRPVKIGRRLHVTEAEIRNGAAVILCRATLTHLITEPPSSAPEDPAPESHKPATDAP